MSTNEIVEIIQPSPRHGALWTPAIGSEVRDLLDSLHKLTIDNKQKLQQEAIDILSRCQPPITTSGQRTGLVIGYVQSGKTMSFTTVSALARDNGYRLIILLSGMTVNLYEQTMERIEKDLRLKERDDRKWQFFNNPKNQSEIRQRIESAFRSSNTTYGIGRKTVLMTVMKNRTHLNSLVSLLKGLSLSNVSTIIIDDEADQASLNNFVRKGKESTTYHLITQLRQLLPHHTFLQYTATPQAPLLINLIDHLSPEFAELLNPRIRVYRWKGFF